MRTAVYGQMCQLGPYFFIMRAHDLKLYFIGNTAVYDRHTMQIRLEHARSLWAWIKMEYGANSIVHGKITVHKRLLKVKLQ